MSDTKDDTTELAATTSADALTIPLSEDKPQQMTAGQLLREARLASGMHIGTLSLALKVPVKKLEALEADDWGHLPDAVFVRALATSVCRQIKVDSSPILAALPQSKSFQDIDEGSKIAIERSFNNPSDTVWRKLNLRLSLPMIVGAGVLLLAALLLIALPDFAKKQEVKKTEVIERVEPVQAIEPTPVQAPVSVAIEPTPMANAPTTALPVVTPSSASPLPLPAPKPELKLEPKPEAKAVAPVPVPSGVSIVRLVARGEVWVEIKDSKGQILVQRTMQPKEVINANGIPPLAVVIGRINEMQSVEVRGKPFSLVGLSPDNVARFDVK